MAADRVDKQWQNKGLGSYSTQAIIGTLGHYGVSVTEAGYTELAATKFPLGIAEEWHQTWKGTGQFSRFPAAAADELWRRFVRDRLMPGDFAVALAQLVSALESMREGSAEAPVGDRFKKMSEVRARVPLKDGKPNPRFIAEAVFHMGDWVRELNHLAENLAKEGHVDDAEEFAELEEFLFPSRAGASKAIVKAAKGDKEGAVADLEALAARREADRENRLSAIDALIQLGEIAKAKGPAVALLDVAEAEKDFHFALELGERLRFVMNKLGPSSDRSQILARLAVLGAEHDEAHPHHGQGHAHEVEDE
jgi:hypothetical protein